MSDSDDTYLMNNLNSLYNYLDTNDIYSLIYKSFITIPSPGDYPPTLLAYYPNNYHCRSDPKCLYTLSDPDKYTGNYYEKLLDANKKPFYLRRYNHLHDMIKSNYIASFRLGDIIIKNYNPIKYVTWRSASRDSLYQIMPSLDPPAPQSLLVVCPSSIAYDFYRQPYYRNDTQISPTINILRDMIDFHLLTGYYVVNSIELGSIPEVTHFHTSKISAPINQFASEINISNSEPLFTSITLDIFKTTSQYFYRGYLLVFHPDTETIEKICDIIPPLLYTCRYWKEYKYMAQIYICSAEANTRKIKMFISFRRVKTVLTLLTPNNKIPRQYYDNLFLPREDKTLIIRGESGNGEVYETIYGMLGFLLIRRVDKSSESLLSEMVNAVEKLLRDPDIRDQIHSYLSKILSKYGDETFHPIFEKVVSTLGNTFDNSEKPVVRRNLLTNIASYHQHCPTDALYSYTTAHTAFTLITNLSKYPDTMNIIHKYVPKQHIDFEACHVHHETIRDPHYYIGSTDRIYLVEKYPSSRESPSTNPIKVAHDNRVAIIDDVGLHNFLVSSYFYFRYPNLLLLEPHKYIRTLDQSYGLYDRCVGSLDNFVQKYFIEANLQKCADVYSSIIFILLYQLYQMDKFYHGDLSMKNIIVYKKIPYNEYAEIELRTHFPNVYHINAVSDTGSNYNYGYLPGIVGFQNSWIPMNKIVLLCQSRKRVSTLRKFIVDCIHSFNVHTRSNYIRDTNSVLLNVLERSINEYDGSDDRDILKHLFVSNPVKMSNSLYGHNGIYDLDVQLKAKNPNFNYELLTQIVLENANELCELVSEHCRSINIDTESYEIVREETIMATGIYLPKERMHQTVSRRDIYHSFKEFHFKDTDSAPTWFTSSHFVRYSTQIQNRDFYNILQHFETVDADFYVGELPILLNRLMIFRTTSPMVFYKTANTKPDRDNFESIVLSTVYKKMREYGHPEKYGHYNDSLVAYILLILRNMNRLHYVDDKTNIAIDGFLGIDYVNKAGVYATAWGHEFIIVNPKEKLQLIGVYQIDYLLDRHTLFLNVDDWMEYVQQYLVYLRRLFDNLTRLINENTTEYNKTLKKACHLLSKGINRISISAKVVHNMRSIAGKVIKQYPELDFYSNRFRGKVIKFNNDNDSYRKPYELVYQNKYYDFGHYSG